MKKTFAICCPKLFILQVWYFTQNYFIFASLAQSSLLRGGLSTRLTSAGFKKAIAVLKHVRTHSFPASPSQITNWGFLLSPIRMKSLQSPKAHTGPRCSPDDISTGLLSLEVCVVRGTLSPES